MEQKNRNEMERMRDQMALLKSKLEEQTIVNETIIRKVMDEKISGINGRMKRICLLTLFGIAYCPWAFRQIGASWLLCGVTVFFLILASFYNIYMRRGVDSKMVANGNLLEIGMKVSRMKRLFRLWLTRIGIPFLCVWIPWLLIDISTVGSNQEYLWELSGGLLVGAIIGGIIGFWIYKRNMNAIDDLLLQIEELKKME